MSDLWGDLAPVTLEGFIDTTELEATLSTEVLEADLSSASLMANELLVSQLEATLFNPPHMAHGLGDHTDTQFGDPDEDQDGWVVTWDGEIGAYVLAPQSGSGGPLSFLDLTDTPNTYTGSNGLYVKVDGNALVFAEGEPGPQGEQGPQGPQGIQGLQGIQGIPGEDGEDGTDGLNGTNGADGDDGDSAYEVAVANGFIGTESEWLESLIGEQGETGPQGIQGIQGEEGEQGETGPTGATGAAGDDGLSAYELAVEEGFIGTLEEWLESLIGPEGPQGEEGPQGDTGPTGPTGPQGGFGGDSMAYAFSTTTTDSDPGSGVIRFNSGTFISITQLFIDDNNQNGDDVQAWLGALDDSTNTVKGSLRVFKRSDFTIFRDFQITGASTEATGYWKIAVTPFLSIGSLVNADDVVITFTRAGNVGATGATGSTGAPGADGDAADIQAEIDAATEQTVLEDANKIPLTDSGVLKYTLWSTIKAALGALFPSWFPNLSGKSVQEESDFIVITDGDDGHIGKAVSYTNFKFTLKDFFDTLYAALVADNAWIGNSTFTTMTANNGPVVSVTRSHAAGSTNAPLVDLSITGADDQPVARLSQSATGSGAIIEFLQGATLVGSISSTGSLILTRNFSGLVRHQLLNPATSDFYQTDLQIGRGTASHDLYIGVNFLNVRGAFIDNRSGGSFLFKTSGTTHAELSTAGRFSLTGLYNSESSTKTISGGAITVTTTFTIVETEGLAAADDLVTINGGVMGDWIILRTNSSFRVVTIKDGTGNISCPGDRVIGHVDDTWVGYHNGARWCEMSYANNA